MWSSFWGPSQYYAERIRLREETLYQENLTDLENDDFLNPYAESTKREYIPPTAEDVTETQQQVRSFDCSTVTDVPQIECEALVALYEKTNGSGWNWNTNWLSSTVVGLWTGISVLDGHVVEIWLDYNNLNGTLPDNLGNLIYLTKLQLTHSQIFGPIPSSFGSLINLKHLALEANNLSGNIPNELGNLSSLELLNLWNNQLSGEIPKQIGNLNQLVYLNLGVNTYSGSIPSELGNLSNLIYMELNYSQLSGTLPSELSNLTNLEVLVLSNNYFSGAIPYQFGQLNKLRQLNLSFNSFSGDIPPQIGDMVNLQSLDLTYNDFSGSIPAEIGKLSELTNLRLIRNKINGTIPPELGNLNKLIYLSLAENQLSGIIPVELGNLFNISTLNLSSNQLEGSLPIGLSNLSNVSEFIVSGNQLSGSIPEEYGNMLNLSSLGLGNNRFTGPIPLSFINLQNLSIINFYNTMICEPSTPEFLAWKTTVSDWRGTGILCEELNQVDLDVSNSVVALAKLKDQKKENQPAITILETTVTNHGPDPTTQFVVEFHDGYPLTDTLITTKSFDLSINSGSSATIQVDWQTQTGSTEAIIYIKVLTSDNDLNLSNNISSEGTYALAAFADFSYNPDTFSFSNTEIDKLTFYDGLDEYSSLIDYFPLKAIYRKIIVPTLFDRFGDGGHCYGMASASIIYWDTPSIKPLAIDTYQMDWETYEVASDIEAMHMRQILLNAKDLFNDVFISLAKPTRNYNWIKDRLIKEFPEPSFLTLFEGIYKSDWKHAVTAYKIVEIENNKSIFIYDNRYPLKTGFPTQSDILYLDEKDNVFYLNTNSTPIPKAVARVPIRSGFEISAEILEDIIDFYYSFLSDDKLLQGYFEWDVSDLLSSPDLDSVPNQEENPTSEIPTHFLILDSSGNKLGYNHGEFVNEMPGSEFVEFDSAFYWLLPANGTYSLETIGNGTSNATFSLAIPNSTSFVQTTIYDGFGIPLDALATTSFSQTTTDWRIEIEGQDDVFPVVDEEIEVEGIKNIFLPLIME